MGRNKKEKSELKERHNISIDGILWNIAESKYPKKVSNLIEKLLKKDLDIK